MTDKELITDGVNVSECERHCSDNYNTPNMCYSDITRGYRHCNPKENQCDFYITSIEKQLARKTQECEQKEKELLSNEKIINKLMKEVDELKQECEELKESNKKAQELYKYFKDVAENTANKNKELENNLHIANTNHEAAEKECDCYLEALEEIEKIAQNGLSPICYKSNCSCCRCYDGDDCNTSMTSLINNYFTENGEFVDGSGDFVEALEGLLESERKKCNKAQPIAQRILDIINKAKGEEDER